jgi:predicted secreted Zn-dependent protease
MKVRAGPTRARRAAACLVLVVAASCDVVGAPPASDQDAGPAPPTTAAVDASGVRNVPCGASTTTTVAAAGERIPVTTTYVCYDVAGSTADAVRAAIDAHPSRPVDRAARRPIDAFTRWDLRVTWSSASSGTECRATTVTPTLAATFTYPRWVPPPAPDRALVERWNAFIAALTTHEDGHRQNGIDATADAVARVRALRASCSEFNAAAEAEVSAAIARGNEADRRYDATTDHGRTQGARFP